jgi:hypothetical protein
MSFTSYKPKRYVSRRIYNVGLNVKHIYELCSTCKLPYGEHYMMSTQCANKKDSFINVPSLAILFKRKFNKKELLKREFYKFLYDYNCLEEFNRNMKNRRINFKRSKIEIFKDPITNWVNNSFSWSSSPEDFDFWFTIEYNWNNYLDGKAN